MARKFGKINVMSEKFEDYNYAILGQGGIGKTTLAYELGKLVAKNDEGTFIITCGLENKTTHIPNAFADDAPDFKTLIEIVNDLCENKTDYPHTKFVAIDSIDEVFRIAEAYIIEEYNKSVDFDKRVRSIKQAYGGYQGGENRVVDVVLKVISQLEGAGYKLIYIGHTKTKSKVDPMTGVSYDQFTCSVDNKYYTAIKDKVNVVATGYFERDFQNLKKKDNPFTKEKGAITTGDLIGQRRVLSLVDDENAIDTKCHFEYIDPKIDFSAVSFIEAVEKAIRLKKENANDVHEAKPLPDPSVEELNKKREAIRVKYRASSEEKKAEVYKYLNDNGIKIDSATDEQLNELFEML